jgi:hypothetical protein
MIRSHMSSLFEPEPVNWGLRGDPFLWREMKANIASKEVNSVNDFENVLHDLFLELTKSLAENDNFIFVEKYHLGGMSSGQVSAEFWLKQAIPLLLSRYEALFGH